MNKSELKQIIKEEINKIFSEIKVEKPVSSSLIKYIINYTRKFYSLNPEFYSKDWGDGRSWEKMEKELSSASNKETISNILKQYFTISDRELQSILNQAPIEYDDEELENED